MQHQTIPLCQLDAHPDNANVMPDRLYRKLVAHLSAAEQYPPLIVRPIGDDRYQLLDGHHRAKALRELGHDAAACVVWQVDDAQALVLLATLNRLSGDDDPAKRGRLIEQLQQHFDLPTLAHRLPEDTKKLGRLIELAQPPKPPTPSPAALDLPVAVHFFLSTDHRRRLDARLKQAGGSREQALIHLLQLDEEQ
jgi:ParB-like chromosome segregation protein Spo0J